jgi:hypothetical protein
MGFGRLLLDPSSTAADSNTRVLIMLEVVEGFIFFLDFFFVPPSRPAWSP